jgi:hypothetical protein
MISIKSRYIINAVVVVLIFYIPVEAFSYTLRIMPYEATNYISQNGLIIQVYNEYTGYSDAVRYNGLPPSSIYMHFSDDQMPIGTDFLICAYHYDMTEIGCERWNAGQYTSEKASIDLSP